MSELEPNENPEKPQTPAEPATPLKKYNAFQALVLILTVMGLFTILAGILNLVGGLLGIVANALLEDVIFNVVFGALLFVTARVLARKNALGLWIFVLTVLISLIYEAVMQRGINYIMVLFGGVVIWQLLRLKKQGEIQ
ncbi:hypothetical protein LARV_01037 [Longilinea arvoryzae]|uniref:Uncharacterized protein n=1 Tax=Longilinea arvoryzae TaxID=360412 RepID=A0A0S7BEG8_9CHLR|nr:hypothetical protein [Longilinea arvoryzae]GAP13284.1 hypothetical protein LARV_01037 [Longilinea arvoryzae]